MTLGRIYRTVVTLFWLGGFALWIFEWLRPSLPQSLVHPACITAALGCLVALRLTLELWKAERR